MNSVDPPTPDPVPSPDPTPTDPVPLPEPTPAPAPVPDPTPGPHAESDAPVVEPSVVAVADAEQPPPLPDPLLEQATATPPPQPALPPQPVPPVPPAPQSHDLSRIAQDLQIRKAQVEAVVQLVDDGNTVPFITRYRKERTGGLDEVQIRRIQHRVTQLRDLASRKQTVLRSIANQGRLTDDLTEAVLAADNPKRLDDLYLPYQAEEEDARLRRPGARPGAAGAWRSGTATRRWRSSTRCCPGWWTRGSSSTTSTTC